MNGWSERTAVFAHDDRRDVTVEITWLPALAGLGPEALADAHARRLADTAVEADEMSVRADASLERPLRSAGQVGLAQYAQRGDRLVRTVATAAEGTPDEHLRSALRVAAERDTAVSMSTLEARFVEGLLGVPAVRFLPAAWWHDLDASVRELIGRELARSLAGRSLVDRGPHDHQHPDDAGPGWVIGPALRRAVEPVLDADLVVIARRIGDDAAHTVVLGRRRGTWTLVQEDEPGRLTFAPIEPPFVVDRLLDALCVPLDIPLLSGATLDDVDAFPVLWQLSCVRAHDEGLQSAELVWCFDSDGRLWTVPPANAGDPTPLQPAGTDELRAALADLLEPQGAFA